MNFAADCLANTGLDATQLGIGFAAAIGAIVIGLVVFGRSWRNRVVLALAPLLILAGIGGMALSSSQPAQAVTSCETATPTPTPTGAAPVLQNITFGSYNGSTYVPNAVSYPSLDPATIYLPTYFWSSVGPAAFIRNAPSPSAFIQQITALGDGAITYTATGLTGPDSMTSSGLVTLNKTTFSGKNDGYSFTFVVTATNEFGSTSKTYTVYKAALILLT